MMKTSKYRILILLVVLTLSVGNPGEAPSSMRQELLSSTQDVESVAPEVGPEIVSTSPAASGEGSEDAGHPKNIIVGTVRGPDGNAVSGICVDVWVAREEDKVLLRGLAKTDAHGRYVLGAGARFSDSDTHEYFPVSIRFRDCRPQPTLAFQWHPGVTDFDEAVSVEFSDEPTVDAVLSEGGALAGRVTSTGGDPVAGACVWLYDDSTTTQVVDEGSDYTWYEMMATDAQGRYRFAGLASGTYRVYFASPWWQEKCTASFVAEWHDDHVGEFSVGNPQPTWPTDTNPIELRAPETKNDIDAAVLLLGRLHGVVTPISDDCGTDDPDDDRDPVTPLIVLFDDAGKLARVTDVSCSGEVEFEGLEPGSYKVEFKMDWDGDEFRYIEWFEDQTTEAAADPVKIIGGQTTKIEADLTH